MFFFFFKAQDLQSEMQGVNLKCMIYKLCDLGLSYNSFILICKMRLIYLLHGMLGLNEIRNIKGLSNFRY